MASHPRISILQYNVNKSKDGVMAPLLNDPRVLDFDIIAIQEPWKNPFMDTTHHPAKDIFTLIYPDSAEVTSGHARVCFFVNKRISREHLEYRFASGDVCTLTIVCEDNEHGKILVHVHNIYNEPRVSEQPVIDQINQLLDDEGHFDNPPDGTTSEHIILGDFNIHHPQWGGRKVTPDQRSEPLLAVIDRFRLTQQVQRGRKTYFSDGAKTWHTLDLVFTTEALGQKVVRCAVRPELDHGSDHLPVETILNLEPNYTAAQPTRLWREADIELLQFTFEQLCPAAENLTTLEAIDQYTETLVGAIQQAITAAVPFSRIVPSHSRPGFNAECKLAVLEARSKRKKFQKTLRSFDDRNHPAVLEAHEKYKKTKLAKNRLVKKTLRKIHRENIEKCAKDASKTWRLAKWGKRRECPFRAFTPPLKLSDGVNYAKTAIDKAQVLSQAFSPLPPEADLDDITPEYEYPEPVEMPEINVIELENIIKAAKSNNAPGPDGIPNAVLQWLLPKLASVLVPLFNSCLAVGHYPQAFRTSITAVLRKAGGDRDFTSAKSYRPIALLNTLGKAFESIIATRISWAAETYKLLPESHLGGRRGNSSEHAVHMLVEKIYAGWNKNQVSTLLLLDVSGAYDNVSHPRLLHNLRKRRLGGAIVKFVASFVEARTTIIRMPEHTTSHLAVKAGIPQGSPISPILYLFYNADLIEACTDTSKDSLCTGWVDDAAILVTGLSMKHNNKTLRTLHKRAQKWEKRHSSWFNPDKYQLVHFCRTINSSSLDPVFLRLEEVTVKPESSAKYLGVVMDESLTWMEHLNNLEGKATKKLSILSVLAGSTWGVTLEDLRRVYISTVLPQILYCASVWYSPHPGPGRVAYRTRCEKCLTSIQKRAAIAIAGVWKTAACAELEIELYLPPIQQALQAALEACLLRLAASAAYQSVTQFRTNEATPVLNSGRTYTNCSPLQKLEIHYSSLYQRSLQRLETKTSFVVAPWQATPSINICKSAEEAIDLHNKIVTHCNALIIYTDGTGIDGKVAAAAVDLFCGNTKTALLGPLDEFTVYSGELYGILMAMQIAKETEPQATRPVIIFTDNQASILSTHSPKRQSGQYILRQIMSTFQTLNRPVEIHWIPAHKDVPGNEVADLEAKETTGWRANGLRGAQAETPPELAYLISATKPLFRQKLVEKWAKKWTETKPGKALRKLQPSPEKATLRLYKAAPRWLSSVMTQMRIGKLGINNYLHKIRVSETRSCECGYTNQTLQHVLLNCPLHDTDRAKMWEGFQRQTFIDRILNDATLLNRAARFLTSMGVLKQFRTRREDAWSAA